MLSLPSAVRIFLCTEPTDMRRGFDRLAEMVRSVIRQDPLSGHLFVFRSRRGDRLRLLYRDPLSSPCRAGHNPRATFSNHAAGL